MMSQVDSLYTAGSENIIEQFQLHKKLREMLEGDLQEKAPAFKAAKGLNTFFFGDNR